MRRFWQNHGLIFYCFNKALKTARRLLNKERNPVLRLLTLMMLVPRPAVEPPNSPQQMAGSPGRVILSLTAISSRLVSLRCHPSPPDTLTDGPPPNSAPTGHHKSAPTSDKSASRAHKRHPATKNHLLICRSTGDTRSRLIWLQLSFV